MTRNEIIRLTRNLVEAETAHAKVRTAYEGDAHNAALRFESVEAWNDLQRARRAMAGIDARDLLRALTVHAVPDGEPEVRGDLRGKRFTISEVQAASDAVDQGEPIQRIAKRTGRNYSSLRVAVMKWRDGTSDLAKRAKLRGVWRVGQ